MRLLRFCLLTILIIYALKSELFAQKSFSDLHNNLTPLFEKNGSGIYKVNDIEVTIVAIDLRTTTFNQSYGEILESSKNDSGKFIENLPSPSFKRISYSSLVDTLATDYLALINASFFENYEEYTPLSFPIFHNNRYITSGSSPFAYVSPKHPYYSTIDLYSLNIFDKYASIEIFDSTNIFSSGNNSIHQQLVSYRYQDHPALIIGNDTKTRFLLVGLVNQKEYSDSEYLLFAFGNNKIGEIAKALRELGVTSEIMTFDGGSSVLLYNKTLGYLETPHVYDEDGNYFRIEKLPHYLYFEYK